MKIILLCAFLLILAACGGAARDAYTENGDTSTENGSTYREPPLYPPGLPSGPQEPTAPARRAEPFAVPASGTYPPMHGPAIQVVQGSEVSFAVLYDHSLWAWGSNRTGELGYGPGAWWSPDPVRVKENVAYVALQGSWGVRRVYAITTDGGLYTWGGDLPGAVGNIFTGEGIRFTPERIMDNVVKVAAGWGHALAVTSGGGLYAWGNNHGGEIGAGRLREYQAEPVRVKNNAIDIAAGGGHSLAVTADGGVYVWGDTGDSMIACRYTHRYGIIERPKRMPDIENAVAVAADGAYGAQSLVLTADGRVWAWGGRAHHGTPNFEPPAIKPITGRVVEIEATHRWSRALTDDGNVWEWTTQEGQRGFWLGAVQEDFLPDFTALYGEPQTEQDHDAFNEFFWAGVAATANAAREPHITVTGVSSLATGASQPFTAELNQWFTPWVYAASGPGPFSPRPPITDFTVPRPLENRVIDVAVREDNSFALAEDGRLWAWGRDFGDTVESFGRIRHPLPRMIIENIRAVEAGNAYILALAYDGGLYEFGATPGRRRRVLEDVIAMSAGFEHALAVTADGRLWAWGGNQYGQLGDGTTNSQDGPVEIKTGVVAVAAGGNQSIAILDCGGLYIWGAYGFHMWDEDWANPRVTPHRTTPLRVMENAASAAAGPWHALAITTEGCLYAWGDNWYGAAGAGEYIYLPTPVRVMCNVRYVTAAGHRWGGGGHTMAVTNDGSLYAWGSYFLLGNGEGQVFRQPPTLIMEDVISVATKLHTMAVTADGHLWAWASENYHGVLAGLGPVSQDAQIPFASHIPVRITAAR